MVNSTCRVCDSETEKKFEVSGWPLVKCPECSLLQVNKMPTPEELKTIYSTLYFSSSKYKNKAPLEKEMTRRLNLLNSCGLTSGAKVLEIGAADGCFLRHLGTKYNLYANDFSPEVIEKLKDELAINPSHLQAGSAEELYFPENFFDAIIMWDVIEHIWEVDKLAKKVSQWLKPKGNLLISSPDVSSLSYSVFRKRWPFMTPPEHLTFFNEKSLRKLFEKYGMDIQTYYRRGKWVDIRFLIYKFGRVTPLFGRYKFQDKLPDFFNEKMIYVPTNDIFYSKLQKRG